MIKIQYDYSRQKNYIGGDDGDSFSERAIDVPYGSFRRSRRFDDVEMANLGRYDRKSNLIFNPLSVITLEISF